MSFLIALAKQGDRNAYDRLVRRYHGFVRLKASSYFLAGGDSDDLIQEGLVGLYKAIRDFRTDRESSFRNFAELCITRQIITAVKTATRNKHTPLNQYVSFSSTPAGSRRRRADARPDAPGAERARPRQPGDLLRGAALAGRAASPRRSPSSRAACCRSTSTATPTSRSASASTATPRRSTTRSSASSARSARTSTRAPSPPETPGPAPAARPRRRRGADASAAAQQRLWPPRGAATAAGGGRRVLRQRGSVGWSVGLRTGAIGGLTVSSTGVLAAPWLIGSPGTLIR